MKKNVWILILTMALMLVLAGCGCEHEWEDANCEKPKTCTKCGETEGAPLGHTWKAATCLDAKTCEVCQKTEGEAKGHTWEAATCLLPEKCADCHETRGEALSHNWQEATTEAPKTCLNCQTTEGDRLITDPRFTTASTKELHGKWYAETYFSAEMLEMVGYIDKVDCTLHWEFGKTGEMKMTIEIHDMLALEAAMEKQYADALYAEFANLGYNKSMANQAMMAEYGMNVEQYADAALEVEGIQAYFDTFGHFEGAYYVGQNGMYTAANWNDEFECDKYTITDGVLVVEEMSLYEDGEVLQWKRAEDKT